MKQPKVAFFGQLDQFTPEIRDKIFEKCTPLYYENDKDLKNIIQDHKPDVFVTTGKDRNPIRFPNLLNSIGSVKCQWLHFDEIEKIPERMQGIFFCFTHHSITFHHEKNEMISLFTSSYKSGEYIYRPFRSLLNQTYRNWEWVIYDDTNGYENWENLQKLKALDPRIRIFKGDGNSGIIGETKNIASSLTRGAYIVELDHDDELQPLTLELIKRAFDEHPDAGFCYSDFAEVFEEGLGNFHYGENFSMGYGSYYKGWCDMHKVWRSICICPQINPITVRWLVSQPNHFRAWRKSTFNEMGGWNWRFHVADDYEILLRTFINTKMVKIPYFCYIQYRNKGGNNFTFIRNAEIQKLVGMLRNFYEPKLNKRISGKKEDGGYELPDPYYGSYNWSKHGQAWHRYNYENYLSYKIHRDDNHKENLLSIIITTSPDECDFDDFDHIKAKVKNALAQDYEPKELIVIRSRALTRVEPRDDNRPDDVKAYIKQQMESFENIFDEFKGDYRIKFWDLEEGDRAMSLTYACKMVALGKYITYWQDDDRPTNHMTESIKQLKESGTLSFEDIVHKEELFKELGEYWTPDEYDIYEKANDLKEGKFISYEERLKQKEIEEKE